MTRKNIVVLFRQDLRLQDNPALSYASQTGLNVIPLYIYDTEWQGSWGLGSAQRWWLHKSLSELKKALPDLVLMKGEMLELLKKVVEKENVSEVVWNRWYEPYAVERQKQLRNEFHVNHFNGSLLIEPWAVSTKKEEPYRVFTPFWKCCLDTLEVPKECELKPFKSRLEAIASDKLDDWGLLKNAPDFSAYWNPGEEGAHEALERFKDEALSQYAQGRDIPSKALTSRLSPHLHFGEIGPRQIWRAVNDEKGKYLTELGWREFSYHLLYHFPTLPHANFNSRFDAFPWEKNAEGFERWKKGMTGYPIVDAGMRELYQTGWMHNRVRMIAASFLIKDLFVDWREGEAWFWERLVDADLASNSASWQWVAGSGADAAPYFRIFNPTLQGEKFDPDGEYVKKWIPELRDLPANRVHQPWKEGGLDYPKPIVDHGEQRKRALAAFEQFITS